jgi:hypothetical protein
LHIIRAAAASPEAAAAAAAVSSSSVSKQTMADRSSSDTLRYAAYPLKLQDSAAAVPSAAAAAAAAAASSSTGKSGDAIPPLLSSMSFSAFASAAKNLSEFSLEAVRQVCKGIKV